ncbi:MAG: hypothetical protein IOC82_12570 [Aestuariivirga sp.]|uniref:hypothetical protein n=1 Tax=Aestuariivirga sp. TaxID=2650926 RepID=UPI0025BA6C93|nr:hypothetical protein [Aestuariivirga sp.]MCA3561852.1 hypothetical protein [Aestuariivirga sp.]
MSPFGKTKPEAPLSTLETLQKAHYGLGSLPETIRILATPGTSAIDAKPITEATLDDIAFALRVLEAEFNAIGDRMHALRKLSHIARDAGGVGADRAVEAAARAKAER